MAGESNETIEEAFRLIKKGHEHMEAKEYWKSADSYSQAFVILTRLSQQQNREDPEHAKIASLYHQQSCVYLKHARFALVSALQHETNEDELVDTTTVPQSAKKEQAPSKLLESLSEDECTRRLKVFGTLFAKEIEDTKTVQEQESSLEKRLNALSNSLPREFKSENERIRDLNRGLKRLGLSGLPTEERTSVFSIDLAPSVAKTETEQVDDIIAQAKDEVAVTGGGGEEAGDDNVDTGLDAADVADTLLNADEDVDDEDDDDVDDADLTGEICKDLHTKLIETQVFVSELVALFEVDADGNAEIEFDQAHGRKLLRDARLQLRQVSDKWSSC